MELRSWQKLWKPHRAPNQILPLRIIQRRNLNFALEIRLSQLLQKSLDGEVLVWWSELRSLLDQTPLT